MNIEARQIHPAPNDKDIQVGKHPTEANTEISVVATNTGNSRVSWKRSARNLMSIDVAKDKAVELGKRSLEVDPMSMEVNTDQEVPHDRKLKKIIKNAEHIPSLAEADLVQPRQGS